MNMTTITNARQDCLVLPYVATTERKAEMFADAIDALFCPRVETEVFEDGGRWGIAVIEGMDEIADPIKDERIVGVAILLTHFDIVESTGEVMFLDDPGRRISYQDIPAALEPLTVRARRAFRIEDKLDAILTALVGTEGAKAIGRLAGDSHRLPDVPPRMTGTGK
jgi:hypothetical protein